MFNLKEMQKKGSGVMGGTADKLIGTLVVLVLVGAFATTIFSNANLSGTGAPDWLVTVTPILVALVFFYIIYRLVKK